MTQRGRFQIKSLVAQQGEVRCHSGLDPLTGLPVLIYTFPGRLAPSLGDLESENIAGILASSFDGKEGQLVVAQAREQRPLREPVAARDVLALLVDTSRALKDAAQAGILHGDLKPERFVKDGSRYLLEGYGVRWQPQASPFAAPDAQREASYAGDVYAWA
ncbi:MAG: hypothetical protein M3511_01520, partial [Deinococcota bacterium]|nr:hypothetical protein [Deinococcota bacterium]